MEQVKEITTLIIGSVAAIAFLILLAILMYNFYKQDKKRIQTQIKKDQKITELLETIIQKEDK